jgi:hypothetical protein
MIVVGCGTMPKQQAFWQAQRQKQQPHQATSWSSSSSSMSTTTATLVMRDKSASYWFQAGDTVRVVENVYMGGGKHRENLRGRVGTVLQTWEKCNVDPTCCCAEQVNPEMAVHVQFLSSSGCSQESSKQETGKNGENEDDSSLSFTYYFSEEELVQVNTEKEGTVQKYDTPTTTAAVAAPSSSTSNMAPFDGMSCTAFKLEELQKMGQKPRSIASFDPQQKPK